MKVKVRLDTTSDINRFVHLILTHFPEGPNAIKVYLTDNHDFTVSAKSLLGAIATMDWNEVWCTCDKSIETLIDEFIILE